MRYLLILSIVGLAACGADGLPVAPSLNVGLKIGPNGITPTVNASTRVGPIGVSVGN